MSFQAALNDALKKRFIEVVGDRTFGGSKSVSQAPYYLANLQDNLIEPMNEQHFAEYGGGSGNELDSKMKALRSSSALTFNTFGNGPVVFNDEWSFSKGVYNVVYEYQLPTLKRNPNPANLDARLVCDDNGCAAYFEFKMLEWLTSQPGLLRPAYLDPENYLIPREDAELFVEAFSWLADCDSKIAIEAGQPLKCRFYHYDAFQMAKHLLAVYTAVVQGEECHPKIALVNCVWDMVHPEKLGKYEEHYRKIRSCEDEEYDEFAEAMIPLCGLFWKRDIDFHLGVVTHPRLLEEMVLSSERRAKLTRYHI